ncbi:hypothetical protein U9R90_05525 [Streptomyces sp. E11-3]|uniref:hypothetical protein n=1 Tax=Streptomyces sp. E11-3 TaxID=3110112 RepID=UPI0039809213
MPTSTDHDLERLAKRAKRRRAELGLALNDINAKAAGVAKATWQRVEKGLAIRETNYVKIDNLLQWAPGSCISILEGREPIPVSDVPEAPNATVAEMPRQEQALDTVQLSLLAMAKGSTAEEIRAMSERVVRDLASRGLI